MEVRTDVVAMIIEVCVAAYAAIAIGYIAHDDLGFSPQAIRDTALVVAVAMAVPFSIDFLNKRLLGTAKWRDTAMALVC